MEQRMLFGEKVVASATRNDLLVRLSYNRVARLDLGTGELSGQDISPDERKSLSAIHLDYASSKWAGFSYVIRSALHKEVRRGDIEKAVQWSRLLTHALGESKTKQYCKQILFEETRNVVLQGAWKSVRGLPGELMTKQIAASVKKWELPSRASCWARYVRAYRKALELGGMASPEEVKLTLESKDLDACYTLFWRVQIAQNLVFDALLDQAIKDALLDSGDEAHSEYVSAWSKHFYTTKLGIELICGVVDASARALIRDVNLSVPDEGLVMPVIEDYVYDNHTRPGLARMVKSLKLLKPGVAQPAQLDVRWSGLVRGVAWREYAFQQHGLDYTTVKWETVSIPAQVWEDTHYMDGYFYASLYRRAGMRDVPFPRG